MFSWLLRFLIAVTFPREFRREYGDEIREAAEASIAHRKASRRPVVTHQVRITVDVVRSGLAERRSQHGSASSDGVLGPARVLGPLMQDIRYGARGLRRSPGFAVVSILTLALGIGGNTAIFSVLNSVVLRPLDFPEAHRIVRMQMGRPLTARHIDGIAERVQSYDALAGGARTSFTLTGDGTPEELPGAVIGDQHREVFGIAPALGRSFTVEDTSPGATPVAMLSYELWQRRFGGDPSLVGRTLSLGGEEQGQRTVVGIWPEAYAPFSWPSEVYVPMSRDTDSHLYVDMARFQLAARLREGVSQASALNEFRATVARMASGSEGAYFSTEAADRTVLVSYQEAEVGGVRGALWLLLGAVGIVLLVACTNVANLVLARSASRSHEFAIRRAIGAGRGRILRQLVTESMLLAGAGGGVGWLGAIVALPLVVRLLPPNTPRTGEISIDVNVLAFAALVSLAAGVLFGLAPALRSTRSVGSALKSAPRGGSLGRDRFRLNRALVGTQIALCVVLVVGSGLLLKSLWRLSSVDPGFDTTELYTLRVRPAADSYPDLESRRAYFAQVLTQIRAVPGVEAAGGIQILPMSRGNMGVGISPDGAPVPESESPTFVGYRMISPAYGAAMGVPLIEGRWIDASDHADAPAVGMINQRMAGRLFPNGSAVGQTVHWNTGDLWFTVVGVIGDVHQNRLDEDVRMEAYVPLAQDGDTDGLHVMIRSPLGPAIIAAARQAAWSVDASVPITAEATMEDVVAASMADRRGQAILFTLFGGLALLLGAIGVYGVTAYTVSQRTHEMGVRIALGAGRRAVLISTLGSSLVPVGVGLVGGFVAALLASGLLANALYQVEPSDPGVLLGVGFFLATVATFAALGPAQRAAKTDPMMVLARG